MKAVPSFIINWVESFFKNRATSILLGNKTSKVEPAVIGIPQGLPILPVLFLFFNGPLIEVYSKLESNVLVGGFVDDVYLLIYSRLTQSNYRMLK